MNEKSKIALLTIESKWAESILDGKKLYEFRRKPPSISPPYYVLLFVTKPTSAVVGEAKIDRVIKKSVDEVISETINKTPHQPADLRAYFDGKKIATALHVEEVTRYNESISQSDVEQAIPDFTPPQNFMYIDSVQHETFLSLIPTYDGNTVQSGFNKFH